MKNSKLQTNQWNIICKGVHLERFWSAWRNTWKNTVWFRIATQAGEFMLNYTRCFENISIMTDKRNSPDSVKLLFQNASKRSYAGVVNVNNTSCRKVTRNNVYPRRYFISFFSL